MNLTDDGGIIELVRQNGLDMANRLSGVRRVEATPLRRRNGDYQRRFIAERAHAERKTGDGVDPRLFSFPPRHYSTARKRDVNPMTPLLLQLMLYRKNLSGIL